MLFPVNYYVDSFIKVDAAKFLSPRSNGRRHAGCDVYVPEGTPVRSVAKGTIRTDLSSFYQHTAAIVVDHIYFVVRYGELSFEPPVESGIFSNPVSGQVEEGRILGYVKRTRYRIPMLHFEMYSGTEKGPLTVRANKPTQRRGDLIDPTDWLVAWGRDMARSATPAVSQLFNPPR
jgi:murein DD-endopeptidase MepM/ murein hydrolase activator NlpD